MIHFFPTFSNDARQSPFAQELTASGVPYRLFSSKVILRYRWRVWLLFFGWPKMAWFALKSAVRSLIFSRPYPDTVVIGSHMEALIFGFFRTLLLRKKPEIVWLGFILTSRRNPIVEKTRILYIGFIFLIVDKVICHSSLEVDRYTKLFNKSRTKFEYIPYGLHVAGRETKITQGEAPSTEHPYILTAGRSGRDYATLFSAIESLAVELHVVCDSESPLAGICIPKNVKLLRKCYGGEYVTELRNSLFVIIPLAVNDISAGQMVLIQAMAFAKPTIITKTPTVDEYVKNENQSLLVTMGSISELRESITRLLKDKTLATSMSANALKSYEKYYCMRAFVHNLIECLEPTIKP